MEFGEINATYDKHILLNFSSTVRTEQFYNAYKMAI